MLSRLALRRALELKTLSPGLIACVRSATTEGPERDLVNFPRPVRAEFPSPVRHLFIPESFFNFFYNKTGVTGPYVWGTGLVLYLLSKEIWVIEHEFGYIFSIIFLAWIINKKLGKQISDFFLKASDDELAELYKGRNNSIQFYHDSIATEKKEQWRAEGLKLVYDAKKDNVGLQLEAVYRERFMIVYSEVKKRLDYQVAIQNVERRIQQTHMVQWIVNNVLKSITAQQEKDTLKKCISDLKALAVARA